MKLKLKSYQFVLLFVVLQFVIFSEPFLSAIWKLSNDYTMLLLTIIFSFLVTYCLLSILLVRRTNKWLPIVLFSVSAVALYFVNNYGVFIDSNMLRNVIETDKHEVTELLNIKLIIYIVIAFISSVIFVYVVEIEYQSFWREVRYKISALLGVLTIIAAIALLTYQQVTPFKEIRSILRNTKIQYLLIPCNYIIAIEELCVENVQMLFNKKTDIAPEAKVINSNNNKKAFVILVIGESARAKNFSLNGYSRDTNAPLKYPVINFSQFTACETATALSVPCIFSHKGHDDFNVIDEQHYSNLLDVLSKLDVSVSWIDNNCGCKGVCANVPKYTFSRNITNFDLCHESGCYDEVMLQDIPKNIVNDKHNLIILHQRGSHAAYHLRTPDKFKKFTASNGDSQCPNDDIINNYDNTIYYTSYFLNKTIELLEQYKAEFNTALIYVSDHGESLGENGIYGHATPYSIAPKEQLHIPAIMWLSPELVKDNHVNMKCMINKSESEFSHDYLFHTVLKLFKVETKIYNQNLDLFYGCVTE